MSNIENLEIKIKGQWKRFYPIYTNGVIEEVDNTKFVDLPLKIFGKYIGGVAGYKPWYVYDTFDKKDIRIEQ